MCMLKYVYAVREIRQRNIRLHLTTFYVSIIFRLNSLLHAQYKEHIQTNVEVINTRI